MGILCNITYEIIKKMNNNSLLSKELEDEFLRKCFHLSITNPEKCNNRDFYNSFYNFVKEKNIFMEDADFDKEEKNLFKKALSKGYIKINVVETFESKESIRKFLNDLTNKSSISFFLFRVYNEEDENKSILEYFEKWGDKPPQGWFANYCHCGSFTPFTPDLSELGDNKIKVPMLYKPITINLNNVLKMEVISDGSFIFYCKDNEKYKVEFFSKQLAFKNLK